MSRALLVGHLALAGARRHRVQTVLLLIAIAVATATLTLALVLHDTSGNPYDTTRAATAGPDLVVTDLPAPNSVVSEEDLTALERLTGTAGVTASGGPYPMTWTTLDSGDVHAGAEVVGRDTPAGRVDRPQVVSGAWASSGSAVLEAAFAHALGAHVGQSITLGGPPFAVAGIAVTAAIPPYPQVCTVGCALTLPQLTPASTGLVWLTQADVHRLVTGPEPLAYTLHLALADPAQADSLARTLAGTTPTLTVISWQDIRTQTGSLAAAQRQALLAGSWLRGVLAIASLAVLVGARTAEQLHRVGLLKAVGATPTLAAAVLLVEYVTSALLAGALGILGGWLVAPMFVSHDSGLLGTAGTPRLTLGTVLIVEAAAVAVAIAATLVPALRAARTSTVRALTQDVHPPRRSQSLIGMSARLPVALMLGTRIAARRPRRTLLSALSLAIAATAFAAVLTIRARRAVTAGPSGGLHNPWDDRIGQILLLVTVMLIVLAAVNALVVTASTILDTATTASLTRALGATPGQVAAALTAAQLLPALLGTAVGIPLGVALLAVTSRGPMAYPPLWTLVAIVPTALLLVAALTSGPAALAARKPPGPTLRADVG